MTHRWMAVMLPLLLCLTACSAASPVKRQTPAGAAAALLPRAVDVLFLYKGELKTDSSAQPYLDAEGRKYHPVEGYTSLAQLREHSRQVFSESFCEKVLDVWAFDPEKPRFIERDGRLWEWRHAGGMGWIRMLIPQTLDVVQEEDSRCIVSGYSQVLTGEVLRTDFVLVKEAAGWRLDSFYEFNNSQEPSALPTLWTYLEGLAPDSSGLTGATVIPPDGTPLEIGSEMFPPFQAVLAALEYDPESLRDAEQPPDTEKAVVLCSVFSEGGGFDLAAFENGDVFITAPDGAVTCLTTPYSGGIRMLESLIHAAKWSKKDLL